MVNNEISLVETVDDYAEWIEKDIPVNSDWVDELNYISYTREEIDQQMKNDPNVDETIVKRVSSLDEQWRKNIKASRDPHFVYDDRPMGDYPDAHWWWHIDKL